MSKKPGSRKLSLEADSIRYHVSIQPAGRSILLTRLSRASTQVPRTGGQKEPLTVLSGWDSSIQERGGATWLAGQEKIADDW